MTRNNEFGTFSVSSLSFSCNVHCDHLISTRFSFDSAGVNPLQLQNLATLAAAAAAAQSSASPTATSALSASSAALGALASPGNESLTFHMCCSHVHPNVDDSFFLDIFNRFLFF